MNELRSIFDNGLNYDNIFFSDYFRTLSAEGKRQKILSEDKFLKIKKQIGELLFTLISDYNGNDSTSIMRETANDIFESLMYILDISLFACRSHEEALDYISNSDIFSIYDQGKKIVKQCIFECVSLIVKLKSNRINFSDISYDNFLDKEAIPYLKRYNYKYFAHVTKHSFSYKPVNNCGGYRGILNFKKMLENLVIENNFINKYSEDALQQLCYGYCESNDREYNDMGRNIYSVVLMNAIFAELCGKSGLEVKKSDAIKVSKMLKKIHEPDQNALILKACKNISSDIYVHNSAKKLFEHIISAVNSNRLSKIIYMGDSI